MLDVTELMLGALVVVLAGAAFALGGRVIRDAWRAGFKNTGTASHLQVGVRELPDAGGPARWPHRPDRSAGPRQPR